MPRTKQRSSERARRRSLREQCSCDLSRFHPWRKEKTILYDVGKNKVPVGNAEWSDEAHDPFLKEHGLEMMELLVMAIYVSLLEGAGWTCMGINGSEACKTFHLPTEHFHVSSESTTWKFAPLWCLDVPPLPAVSHTQVLLDFYSPLGKMIIQHLRNRVALTWREITSLTRNLRPFGLTGGRLKGQFS